MSGGGGEAQSREALVASLAQEFSDRHRKGERPTIDEYVARHPDLEAEIRELFPMLCVLEELGPESTERAAGRRREERGPPRQLGEYRIIREIGRGGMGVVYEAEQESLKRRVAIKVLPFNSFQDEQQLERFRREAQAAARLHHTNIVPVFGVGGGVGDQGGSPNGVRFYVMQLIRGQTLAQVLQEVRRLRAAEGAAIAEPLDGEEVSAASVARTLVEGDENPAPPVPAERSAARSDGSSSSLGRDSRSAYFQSAARIALQVAEGLAYAHNEGVLHRDIKPSNLLIDLRGTVWITDFGLAKVQGSGELTASGGLVGTIRYMAPERFRGHADTRSDVYSLGVTLYELLTLRPAFAASDRAEVVRDVTSREPPRPRRLDAAIPRDLETVVLKAIAKEPADRYASAASLADDLRRFLHREPVSARRASPPERLWRWAQRNPALASATSLIALLLVAMAAGGMISAAWQRAISDEAKARLVQAKLEEGRASRHSREPGGRGRSLAALRQAVTPESANRVRSEIIGALALVDLEEVYRREADHGHVFSDDLLTSFAVPLADGEIHVFEDVELKKAVARLPGDGREVNYLVLSPGGAFLAADYLDDGHDTNVLWDVGRRQRLLESRMPSHRFQAAFDHKGERFAYLDGEGYITICSLPTGSVLRRLEEKGSPNALSFAPCGRRLAAAGFGYNASTVLIFDIDTGEVTARLHHPQITYSVAWHPGGRWLAVACHDFKVHVWDPGAAVRRRTLEGHSAEVVRVAYSHGGRFLASCGWDNRTLLWEAATGDLLTEAAGKLTAFSRDDRRLGIDQGTRFANVWRLNGGACCRTLDAPMAGKGPRDLDIAADGTWLAAASNEEGVRLWWLASPEECYQLRGGHVLATRFQHGGTALWTGADEGLFRWPVSRNTDATEWSFGPPERIGTEITWDIALSRDGLRAATVAEMNGQDYILVHELDGGAAEVRGLWLHPGASQCEISPSGRWVVCTTFQGKDVRVWDVPGGSLACTFEIGTAGACFSPDDRWLALSWDSWVALHETGSWKQRFKTLKDTADRVGGALEFTADGRFLAAALSRSLVALLRVEDGGEVARFEAPTAGLQIHDLALDDDQRFLAASSTTRKVVLWNLRPLRLELREMGLDWSAGEPLAGPAVAAPPRVRVDPGSLPAGVMPRGERAILKNRLLETFSRRVELDPSPDAYRARAAVLEEAGDWSSALVDLDRVLEAAPDDLDALARRALNQERLGRREEAARGRDRVIALYRAQPQDFANCRAAMARAATPALLAVLRAGARSRSAGGLSEIGGALAGWKEVHAIEPGDAEARGQIAWLWIVERCARSMHEPADPEDEDARLAVACAEANYRARPEDGICARDLGAIRYHLGRLEEARPLLEKSWSLDRRLFSSILHLAMIEHHQGDPARARRLFEEAAAEGRKSIPEKDFIRPYFETILNHAERVLAFPSPAERP